MMKKFAKVFLLTSLILSTSPAFANTSYRQFKYKANCYLENKTEYLEDLCTVVETREKTGGLRTRNIFSNRFGLTVKSWFDNRGFMTWDSHNKFEYRWDYKVGNVNGKSPVSYVMPGFMVEDISWD